MKEKILAGKRLEWAAFLVLCAAYCIISYYHEPWFDEAQAWLIARDASYGDILFLLPHYECHPPLWHLILSLPAKLGAPFEAGLKSVGFLIYAATAFLLLFQSRLPRAVRLLLPLGYFFFYQYGIVVRPYGLMLLVSLLLGMAFQERERHPWRVMGLLTLLCLLNAYGMVIAGGIAAGMVIELWQEKGFVRLFRELFSDRRSASLAALLAVALLLAAQIMPRPDTNDSVILNRNPFLLCLLCALFTFPGECLLTTASWFNRERILLQTVTLEPAELAAFSLIGVILWVFIACVSSKRNLKFLLLPYLMFSVFAAAFYFSGHHLGIVVILFLFWLELSARDGQSFEVGRALLDAAAKKDSDRRLLRRTAQFIALACLLVPVYWTLSACASDVRYHYFFGRDAAAFIQEKGLEDAKILAMWNNDASTEYRAGAHEDYVNTSVIGTAVAVNPYFDHNIFLNLNFGEADQGYLIHRSPDYEESRQDVARWVAAGAPDLIVGKPDLEVVYGDSLSYDDYELVHVVEANSIWKTHHQPEIMPIFARRELLEEYHLEPVTGNKYWMLTPSVISDEMREAYENGVPIEDIVNSALDEMFGDAGKDEAKDAGYWVRAREAGAEPGEDSAGN